MNGSKAKTLMIIAFLLLNIFLGYQLWGSEETHNREQTRAEANLVATQVLKQQMNIDVAVDLPVDTPEVDILEVERKALKGEEIAKLLWPDLSYQYNAEEDCYYWQGQSLIQVDPYTLYYQDNSSENTRCLDADFLTKHLPRALQDTRYLAIGEPLLKYELKQLLGLDYSKYYLERIELIQPEEGEDYYQLFLIQKFVYPLFDRHSYAKVIIDTQGVIRELKMEQVVEKQLPPSFTSVVSQIKDELFSQQGSSILSAAEALFIHFGNQEFAAEAVAVVDKIYLAYYGYGMEELEDSAETLASWSIIPVWCVNLSYENDEGEKISEIIYLNAFTGRQEKHIAGGIQ